MRASIWFKESFHFQEQQTLYVAAGLEGGSYAAIIKSDIQTCVGMLHIVDAIIVPPDSVIPCPIICEKALLIIGCTASQHLHLQQHKFKGTCYNASLATSNLDAIKP
jgi:hypothetical protein